MDNQIVTTEKDGALVAAQNQNQHEPRSEIMGVIMEAVRDPRVDTGKMEALFRLKREEEDREAQRAFNRAFVSAKAEIRPVFRNKANGHTKSKYADSYALADQIDPVLEKHGLALSYSTEFCEAPGHYRIVCDLIHDGGHSKKYQADIPSDGKGTGGNATKTQTHAFGSSITYGKRYLKMMIFDIATRDDDGNAAGTQDAEGPMTEQQVDHLRRLLAEAGKDEAKFIAYLNSQDVQGDALEDMAFNAYEPARKTLEKAVRANVTTRNQEIVQ